VKLAAVKQPAVGPTDFKRLKHEPTGGVKPTRVFGAPEKGYSLGVALDSIAIAQTALPKFVYPSVFGTPTEVAETYRVLDSLPFRQAVLPTSITFKDGLPVPDALGFNRIAVGAIEVNRTGYGMENPELVRYCITHEVGHSVDHPNGMGNLIPKLNHSSRAPFGAGNSVTEYGATEPAEDFAESYAHYRLKPQELEKANPAKYAEMKRIDRSTFMERIVDQTAFRETGKYVGQKLSIHPWLRTGAEVLRQATCIGLLYDGVKQVGLGTYHQSGVSVTAGLLGTTAGACLMLSYQQPLLGVAALGALGARQELERAALAGETKGVQIASAVGGGVGGLVGGTVVPLGLTYAGYNLGGPLGGAIGMVAGGLLGNHFGARLGAQAARSLAS
jgi:hypothetical protein